MYIFGTNNLNSSQVEIGYICSLQNVLINRFMEKLTCFQCSEYSDYVEWVPCHPSIARPQVSIHTHSLNLEKINNYRNNKLLFLLSLFIKWDPFLKHMKTQNTAYNITSETTKEEKFHLVIQTSFYRRNYKNYMTSHVIYVKHWLNQFRCHQINKGNERKISHWISNQIMELFSMKVNTTITIVLNKFIKLPAGKYLNLCYKRQSEIYKTWQLVKHLSSISKFHLLVGGGVA